MYQITGHAEWNMGWTDGRSAPAGGANTVAQCGGVARSGCLASSYFGPFRSNSQGSGTSALPLLCVHLCFQPFSVCGATMTHGTMQRHRVLPRHITIKILVLNDPPCFFTVLCFQMHLGILRTSKKFGAQHAAKLHAINLLNKGLTPCGVRFSRFWLIPSWHALGAEFCCACHMHQFCRRYTLGPRWNHECIKDSSSSLAHLPH